MEIVSIMSSTGALLGIYLSLKEIIATGLRKRILKIDKLFESKSGGLMGLIRLFLAPLLRVLYEKLYEMNLSFQLISHFLVYV